MSHALRPAARLLAAAIAVILSGIAGTSAANAACAAAISDFGPTPVITYDPFEGILRTVDVTVRFVNGGADPCTLAVAVGSRTPGALRQFTHGADSLAYRVKAPGGAEFLNDLTAPMGAVFLEGGVGKQASLTFRVEVPAGLIAPTGSYDDLLTVRAYDVTAAPVRLGLDRTAAGVAVIPARAQVNLAGASGGFGGTFGLDRIDFGILQVGETRNAFVQVRATSPVTITVSSANRGLLRHDVLKEQVGGVAYALSLDGQPAALAGGPYALDRSPPITLDGISYPLALRITGPLAGLPAGVYKDTLTVDVVPR